VPAVAAAAIEVERPEANTLRLRARPRRHHRADLEHAVELRSPLEDPSYLWIQRRGARIERLIGGRIPLLAVDSIEAVARFSAAVRASHVGIV
jgi:hypothetical protein